MVRGPNEMVLIRDVEDLIRLTQVSWFSNSIGKTGPVVLNRKHTKIKIISDLNKMTFSHSCFGKLFGDVMATP
jgi:hypothetical protein